MEGSNGSNGAEREVPTNAGPLDDKGERMKGEQEVIARAISGVAHPETHWTDLEPEQREVYMEMAAVSVAAAMTPLPEHENAPPPPYPAELLDELANQLAYKYLNPGHFAEGMRQALDRYQLEVGKENVSDEVAKAIATL